MQNLNKKDFEPESFVNKALEDPKILAELMNNLLAKDEIVRYNSHKILIIISQDKPEVLYPHWDFFADLLKSKNNFHKVIGIQILANLTKIDTKNKFEDIFEIYCNLLDAKSVMTAGHLAANLGIIAKVKPNLRDKLTKVLLSIDETHHEISRKDLIKAYIIESFNEYFNEIENKEEIIKFVKAQLECKSPKTRKAAEKFLKKYN
ncbi:MAG: hypothetical protein ACFE8M_04860 [Candidatus Hermodarchaeota archaeon]